MELIFEFPSPNAFTSRTISEGITTLNHKTFDDTMEYSPVEVTISSMGTEILNRLWAFDCKKLDCNIAVIRTQYCCAAEPLLTLNRFVLYTILLGGKLVENVTPFGSLIGRPT